MTMLEEIEKEKQLIAQCERSLALEKLKKRRADTRRKIELGGLVIKSGMGKFDRSVILGSLDYISHLVKENFAYELLFKTKGESLLKK
ncbi:TPA: conjugal transfer protein TraD [Legionella pneumophila]|uniref:conjugal transfer protein TraD n=1 Tax=Legionella pneumophila TaxID=446 RepID=UPI000D7CC4B3|nr:conjugal transfer protein TraD [Legionella pneumophila]HAT9038830.1 conjugal transfer protein TraD [Legionella pneumophila subsp. pneumophila]MDF1930742.1 conjugal transfer protein TraD [Legionella pneumophila]PYB43835.1 conjugal transfer protein TraD [Legionella pneumophila]PYB49671.1 conjugal transfer protein TraD [Legionella pneumophila]PYB62385.1 conjugal transfer protein TraD [Legionella pneumophila]